MYLMRDEDLSACGLTSSDSVLVALSGGADSVALLLELKRMKDKGKLETIAAAHLNHGIRGEEAARDAAFCRDLCEQLQIPLYIGSADVPAIARLNKQSLEMAARSERYRYLEQVRQNVQCTCIATGHHQEDQAETVLMHLIRGCGVDGLCGMRARSGTVVRPLLTVSKESILRYLEERGQRFCTDSTNADDTLFRNRVRSAVMPLLRSLNPQVTEALYRTAHYAAEDSDYLNAETERILAQTENRFELATLPNAIRLRVLRRYLPYDSFDRQDLETLDSLLLSETGTQRSMKNGCIAWVDSEKLHVSKLQELAYRYPLTIGKSVCVPGGSILWEPADQPEFPCPPNIAYLDADCTKGNLFVRSRMDGDRFTPFGMQGSKLLSDYFTDRKVPRFFRNVPLICDESGILFIAGFTIDNRVRVTPQTNHIWKITYKEDGDHVG